MNVSVSVSIFIFLLKLISAKEQWIDPHDLHINSERVDSYYRSDDHDHPPKVFEKQMDPHDLGINSKRPLENISDDSGAQHATYLRRIISIILNKVNFDQVSETYSGQFQMEFRETDFALLKNFVSSENTGESTLRQISEIFDNCIRHDVFDSEVITYLERISNLVLSDICIVILGSIGILWILWRIQPQNYNLSTLFKLFLPIVYIADFALRYIALLEEAEIDQYLNMVDHQNYDPNNEGWFVWMLKKFYIVGDERKNFLLSQRAIYHVKTPLLVIGQQFDILIPIFESLGKGSGKFITSMMDDSPWYGKALMGSLAFTLVIVVLLMMGSYMFQISPKLNIGYLLHLEFAHREHVAVNSNNSRQENVSGQHKIEIANYMPCIDGSSGSTKTYRNITYKTKRHVKSIRRRTPAICSKSNLENLGNID